MCTKSQILKEILKFVAPVIMHFHFCQKYECLGAKNVVLHIGVRPSAHFGLGTVSKVPCAVVGLKMRYCPRARVIM